MKLDSQLPVRIEGNEHRLIQLADFYYNESIPDGRSKIKKIDRKGIAENILVIGSDRIKILNNEQFVKGVYAKVYGKEKAIKMFSEKTLSISKLVFKKVISLSNAPEYQ